MPDPAASLLHEVLLDASRIRARMHALDLQPWQVAVRSSCAIAGSALRRVLNNQPIARSKALALAHVLRCELREICKEEVNRG